MPDIHLTDEAFARFSDVARAERRTVDELLERVSILMHVRTFEIAVGRR